MRACLVTPHFPHPTAALTLTHHHPRRPALGAVGGNVLPSAAPSPKAAAAGAASPSAARRASPRLAHHAQLVAAFGDDDDDAGGASIRLSHLDDAAVRGAGGARAAARMTASPSSIAQLAFMLVADGVSGGFNGGASGASEGGEGGGGSAAAGGGARPGGGAAAPLGLIAAMRAQAGDEDSGDLSGLCMGGGGGADLTRDVLLGAGAPAPPGGAASAPAAGLSAWSDDLCAGGGDDAPQLQRSLPSLDDDCDAGARPAARRESIVSPSMAALFSSNMSVVAGGGDSSAGGADASGGGAAVDALHAGGAAFDMAALLLPPPAAGGGDASAGSGSAQSESSAGAVDLNASLLRGAGGPSHRAKTPARSCMGKGGAGTSRRGVDGSLGAPGGGRRVVAFGSPFAAEFAADAAPAGSLTELGRVEAKARYGIDDAPGAAGAGPAGAGADAGAGAGSAAAAVTTAAAAATADDDDDGSMTDAHEVRAGFVPLSCTELTAPFHTHSARTHSLAHLSAHPPDRRQLCHPRAVGARRGRARALCHAAQARAQREPRGAAVAAKGRGRRLSRQRQR